MEKRRHGYIIGKRGEKKAKRWLEERGFTIEEELALIT